MGLAWKRPWITPGDKAKIMPSMYLAIEYEIDEATFEDDIIVTESGVEVLTKTKHVWWQ